MIAVFLASASGWVIVVLAAATISLPYLLRGDFLKVEEGQPPPYLIKLKPHYWIGYGILAFSFAHAWVAMSVGLTRMVDLAGIYLASGALAMLSIQFILGLRLRKPHQRNREKLRRWHFWTMLGVLILGLTHIVLNSAVMRAILR